MSLSTTTPKPGTQYQTTEDVISQILRRQIILSFIGIHRKFKFKLILILSQGCNTIGVRFHEPSVYTDHRW